MPIIEPCPMCDLGLLRADRVEVAFECDHCGAQLAELPRNPDRSTCDDPTCKLDHFEQEIAS